MSDERDALRLQYERARDAAYAAVRELRALQPDAATGGAVQIEVCGARNPDTGEWLDYFVPGVSGLGDNGVTLGPG